MAQLYLASSSPRRRELLMQIGVPFSVLVTEIDETPRAAEPASDYVQRLALEKAQASFARLPSTESTLVLGADTAVVLDGQILGKPRDYADFQRMMRALSGRTHQVLTAVAVVSDACASVQLVSSDVVFLALTDAQMSAYWQTGEPCDKAGGYGIQGLAAVFIKSMSGSYSAVVGLPLCETAALLEEFGVLCWQLNQSAQV